jgi:hypothetical protein
MKYRVIAIIKRIVKLGLKLIEVLKNWLTVPVYAKKHGYRLHKKGLKYVTSMPINGPFNAYEEQRNTLDSIIRLFESEKIKWFVGHNLDRKVTIVVMVAQRKKAMQILDKNKSLSGYYYRLSKEKYNMPFEKPLDNGLPVENHASTAAVSIYRHVSASKGRMLEGSDYAITVEFWSRPEDMSDAMLTKAMYESGITDESILKDTIIASTPNKIAKVVAPEEQKPATIEVLGKKYPSIALFNKKFLTRVDFPIDLVYTWVDGADPEWLKAYEKAKQEIDPHFKNNSMARYTDHEELRYSLRSIEMYAPWVRNIYIVSAGQRPKWLKDVKGGRVQIIDHKDIFTDPKALPVFNSHAIESQLHHIEGLSEHYMYLNDDMFFAKPTKPEDFFFANGVAKVQPSPATIGTGLPTKHESAPSSAGKNARVIVEQTFDGVFAANKYKHTICPQNKSVAQIIERKNKKSIDETMHSKFRDPSNVPFTSTLMQSYLLASGKGVNAPFKSTTINVSKDQSIGEMNMLLKGNDYLTICLNESDTDITEAEKVAKRAISFMKMYYPFVAASEN